MKIKCLLIIWLILAVLPLPVFSENPREIRALWVKFEELATKEKIDQLIATARDTNINLIFAQVRRLGVVLYPSKVERTSSLVPADFDPLDYLTTAAHQEKIEVHAWVNVFYVWTKNLKFPGDHITDHREWLLNNSYNLVFLDPGNAQVQEYLLNLLGELAANYPVDGIHLDYVRFPHDTSDGFQKFLADNVKSDLPQTKEFWAEYRRDRLSNFVKKISEKIYQVNPAIKLSAAVIPDQQEAAYYKGQNWPQWLSDGILDFAVLMCYSSDWEIIKNQLILAGQISPNRFIVAGLGVWRQNNEKTSADINELRKLAENCPPLKGFALFSYDSLKTRPDSFKHLKETVLSFFAELPVMPWKKQKLTADILYGPF